MQAVEWAPLASKASDVDAEKLFRFFLSLQRPQNDSDSFVLLEQMVDLWQAGQRPVFLYGPGGRRMHCEDVARHLSERLSFHRNVPEALYFKAAAPFGCVNTGKVLHLVNKE